MLFTETKLRVADNSGATLVKCIKVPGSSKPRPARFGDVIVVSTRIVKPKHNIKKNKRLVKGAIYKAIVMRTKRVVFSKDASTVKFFENKVVMVKKAQPRTFGGPKLAGNRVFGPICYHRNLKKKFPKLYALASNVLY
jgi:large subunit ribosomal protein L14